MVTAIRNVMDRLFHGGNGAVRAHRGSEAARGVEPLEQRLLMAAGPRITSIAADNRGEIVLTLDRALNPTTVTNSSVQLRVLSRGRYRIVPTTVTYNAKRRQITATAALKADTPYMIYLVSKKLRGADGARLDGDFNGAAKPSGNGTAGGDFLAITKVAAQPVARFSTVYGAIDVRLFATQTPLTVQNFLRYANATGSDAEYSWDNTFIHRSIKGAGSMIVGGGYKVNAENELDIVYQRAAVPNEPNPGNPGNIRGTLGMYKLGGAANSATNQWYFNTADNRATLDTLNGGYAVFGQITNNAGLQVMDKIAALKTYNLDPGSRTTPFTQAPVIDGDAVIARGKLNPAQDLVVVRRVAILMDVVAMPATSSAKAKAASAAAHASPAQPALANRLSVSYPQADSQPKGSAVLAQQPAGVLQRAGEQPVFSTRKI